MSKVRFADFISANVPADSEGTGYRSPLRSMVAAAEHSENHGLLRQISAMCRRFNVSVDPAEIIDPVQLQRDLDNSHASTLDKISLKTAMAQVGLIR